MIYGERIKQVRELQGWTQTELAAALGVSQPFVAQVEGGWAKPSDAFMNGLVFKSGFLLPFFETAPEEDFPLGSLLFRAHADMTEREQKSVHRHAQIVYGLLRRMVREKRVKEVPLRLPRCPGDPDVAARVTRSELGLSPDLPIKNLVATLERAGVLIVALPRSFHGADAFSMWATTDHDARRPVIVLSSNRPADRMRMSIAHELGHLVMHQPAVGQPDVIEDEAKRFAPAFLVPEEPVRQDLNVDPLTLETFVNLKLKWGVAIQALVVRAYELGVINQRKYKYMFEKLSARGWRTHEPMSTQIPLERPRALRQIAELIYGTPIDYAKLARDSRLTDTFVRELMSVQAAKTVAATPQSPQSSPTSTTNQHHAERAGVVDFHAKRKQIRGR